MGPMPQERRRLRVVRVDVGLRFAHDELGNDLVVQAIEEGTVAGQVAAYERTKENPKCRKSDIGAP